MRKVVMILGELIGIGFLCAALWAANPAYVLWPIYAFLAYVLLVLAFVSTMKAKAVLASGQSIAPFFLVPMVVGGVLGLALDVLWSQTIGWIIYREWPFLGWIQTVGWLVTLGRLQVPDSRVTFTARCAYHKRQGGWRGERATWWCDELNKFDAGHC